MIQIEIINWRSSVSSVILFIKLTTYETNLSRLTRDLWQTWVPLMIKIHVLIVSIFLSFSFSTISNTQQSDFKKDFDTGFDAGLVMPGIGQLLVGNYLFRQGNAMTTDRVVAAVTGHGVGIFLQFMLIMFARYSGGFRTALATSAALTGIGLLSFTLQANKESR